ncbi:MAG: diguanylate cyclase [Alphaproteobacteria bacterium]|nr:diguanylate cyclase [Alphaproteobacteria bacterium]
MPTDELLAAHEGPAVLFDGAGTVLAANHPAAPLVSALRGPLGGELRAMLDDVLVNGGVPSQRIKLPIATGQGVFDITLLPEDDAGRDDPGGTEGAGQRRILLLARDSTFDVNFSHALVASRQLFKDLVSCSADFSWETDAQGCFTFISGRGLLGYTPDELDGRPSRDLLADRDAGDEDWAGLNPFESNSQLDEVECWLLDRDGARACVRASCLPVLDETGTLQGVRGVCRDITRDKLHQAALERAQERERLSRSIVDSIRDALTPEEMFDAAAAATAEAIAASHIWILRDDKQGGLKAAADHIASGGGELDILAEAEETFAGDPDRVHQTTVDGHQLMLVPCHFRHHPKGVLAVALDDGGDLDEVMTTLRDIASQLGIAMAQAEIQERLEELSIVDELTGLLNRRGFYDSVGKRVAQHRRQKRFGALLFIYLDYFKSVNDTHGHQTGDAALVAVAEILNSGKGRKGDISGRFGGDEFALWLEETDLEGALHKSEELLARTEALRQFSGDAAHPLSFSIGIAIVEPDLEEDLEGLIHRADSALYQAKRDGRGRAVAAERPTEMVDDGQDAEEEAS